MIKSVYRRLFSIAIISCLSLSLFSCGSKPVIPDTEEETDSAHLVDPQIIIDEAVATSSTPTKADNTNYSEKVLPVIGITLNLPEAFVNTDGFINYRDQTVSDGEGLYVAIATYVAMSQDDYTAIVSEDMSDEDMDYIQSRLAPIFAIMAIDDGRDASDLVAYVNDNELFQIPINESDLTKLAEVDGCSYFNYDFGDIFPAKFDEPYQTEYDTLMSLREELLINATFVAPQRPFSDIIGTKLSFTTTDLDGNTITSDEIFSKNEVTMVNVWATWCVYCVDELPELEVLNSELADKDCAIIGVLGDDGLDDETLQLGKEILKDSGVTYLNILPWEGWDYLKPEAWPTSYFVNRAGYIVGTPVQGARFDMYESRIDSILTNDASVPTDEEIIAGTADSSYRIYVVDENSNPISGVTVQFCTEETCKMSVTGESGMVSFDDPEGIEYEIHILKAPDGYKMDSNVYYSETYYSDLTITLKKK